MNAASQLVKPAVRRVREVRSQSNASNRADYGISLIVAALGSQHLLPQNIHVSILAEMCYATSLLIVIFLVLFIIPAQLLHQFLCDPSPVTINIFEVSPVEGL